MYIKGIDNGYGYTKSEDLTIFKSTITTIEPMTIYNNEEHHHIIINNKEYWVGYDKGNCNIEINKIQSEMNKVCTLTMLAMCDDTNFKIIAGLPIAQYHRDKDLFRDTILSYNGTNVIYNDIQKSIYIEDVKIYPQSLSSLYATGIKDDIIIVDIGYRTVDVVSVIFSNNKPHVKLFDTYYCGIYPLYDTIACTINNKFNLTVTIDDIPNIINKGLYIDGIKQDISFLSNIMLYHFQDLFNQLITKYPVRLNPIMLVGGGAKLVINAFKHRFNTNVSIHPNNQFANAVGYYNIGRRIFCS